MFKKPTKKKILIADDDPAIVEALDLILTEFGYTVQTSRDGKTFAAIKQNMPHLLLLDVWMSGEDGRKICTQLKKEQVTKNIPVILISASSDMEKSAFAAGANDFLAKPFDMTELLAKIEKWT